MDKNYKIKIIKLNVLFNFYLNFFSNLLKKNLNRNLNDDSNKELKKKINKNIFIKKMFYENVKISKKNIYISKNILKYNYFFKKYKNNYIFLRNKKNYLNYYQFKKFRIYLKFFNLNKKILNKLNKNSIIFFKLFLYFLKINNVKNSIKIKYYNFLQNKFSKNFLLRNFNKKKITTFFGLINNTTFNFFTLSNFKERAKFEKYKYQKYLNKLNFVNKDLSKYLKIFIKVNLRDNFSFIKITPELLNKYRIIIYREFYFKNKKLKKYKVDAELFFRVKFYFLEMSVRKLLLYNIFKISKYLSFEDFFDYKNLIYKVLFISKKILILKKIFMKYGFHLSKKINNKTSIKLLVYRLKKILNIIQLFTIKLRNLLKKKRSLKVKFLLLLQKYLYNNKNKLLFLFFNSFLPEYNNFIKYKMMAKAENLYKKGKLNAFRNEIQKIKKNLKKNKKTILKNKKTILKNKEEELINKEEKIEKKVFFIGRKKLFRKARRKNRLKFKKKYNHILKKDYNKEFLHSLRSRYNRMSYIKIYKLKKNQNDLLNKKNCLFFVINNTKNNLFITITNNKKEVIFKSSLGHQKLKNIRKRRKYCYILMAKKICELFKTTKLNYKLPINFIVIVKAKYTYQLKHIIRNFFSIDDFKLKGIRDYSPRTHNGCRLKKKRRK